MASPAGPKDTYHLLSINREKKKKRKKKLGAE